MDPLLEETALQARAGRHARDRSTWWPLVPGVLIGMTIGIVVFANIWAAIR